MSLALVSIRIIYDHVSKASMDNSMMTVDGTSMLDTMLLCDLCRI
jgi:hypothetical protein